jgi:hypothetical protein
MSSFVTVATFTNSFNAHLLKGRLEAEGIPAYIKDEHTVGVNPLYDVALGGIKLQVAEEQETEARRILAENGYVQPLPVTPVTPTKKPLHPLLSFLWHVFLFCMLLLLLYIIDEMPAIPAKAY